MEDEKAQEDISASTNAATFLLQVFPDRHQSPCQTVFRSNPNFSMPPNAQLDSR